MNASRFPSPDQVGLEKPSESAEGIVWLRKRMIGGFMPDVSVMKMSDLSRYIPT